ncbi:MAG: response regulator transcription factor [Ktedonobacteraceae bacterium]
MQDKDAAKTTPGGNNMSVVNELSSDEAPVFVGSALNEQEKPKTRYRILVVEDDSSLARLEASFLSAQDYIVVIASTGELAITTISDFNPDLVVLDLELPGLLSGWDVLQVLRQRARIPVLLTTSLTLDMRKYLRTSGETRLTLDHLPKPYPMQTLLKRVKRMLMITPQ